MRFPWTRHTQLGWTFQPTAASAHLMGSSHPIHFSEWLHACGLADRDRVLILQQMVELDLATVCEGFQVDVPYGSFHQLEPHDLQALGVAENYPFWLRVHAQGAASDDDFAFRHEFLDADGRPFVGLRRTGALLAYGEQRWLLSRDLYRLVEGLERLNGDVAGRGVASRLLGIAEVQDLANATGVRLDEYLREQDVIAPGRVSIRLRSEADGALTVVPDLGPLPEPERFARDFEESPVVRDVYTMKDAQGRRCRLVPQDTVREALREIKPLRRLKGEEKQAFLDRPRDFLPSPAVDLEQFGERVKEIGVYRYRFYPYLVRKPNSWLPEEQGVRVEREDGADEPSNVPLDAASLSEFRQAFEDARDRGHSSFEFRGMTLPVDDETNRKMATLEQAAAGAGPAIRGGADRDPGPGESGDPRILIIYENVEEEEFVAPAVAAAELDLQPPRIPPDLASAFSLLPHQEHGLSWLQGVAGLDRSSGALLADDMGLGKTLQVWAFLEERRTDTHGCGPVLVVAPVGLLDVWCNEYAKFFTGQEALSRPAMLILHGAELQRLRTGGGGREIMGTARQSLDTWAISRYPVVLTSYETVRDYQFSLASIDWDTVVIDEAQKVKNPTALTTMAIKALKARFRLAATGTPVENSLADLWCLMDFVVPGRLGCLKDFLKTHTPESDADFEELSEKVKRRASPHFLRRRKKDILQDLPPRHDRHVPVPMAPLQRMQYIEAVEGYRCAKDKTQASMLRLLQDMRRLCCLARGIETMDLEGGKLPEILDYSAKLAWLVDLLGQIQAKGEKVLVFVELKDMQRVLARVLGRVFRRDISIINGDVSPYLAEGNRGVSRRDIVRRFEGQQGFDVLILSPVAAGVGLTVTQANHVIHFMRHWNPAKEDQATDRVYRIGQERPVHVYYPLCTSEGFATFDQRLDELLSQKRRLAESALFPTLYGEVKPADLWSLVEDTPASSGQPLDGRMVHTLDSEHFLATVALLHEKQGYSVSRTAPPHLGASLLARKGSEVHAIMAKWARFGPLSQQGVLEVVSGTPYYAQREEGIVKPMVACNREFSDEARRTAKAKGVILWEATHVMQALKRFPVHLAEVEQRIAEWAASQEEYLDEDVLR